MKKYKFQYTFILYTGAREREETTIEASSPAQAREFKEKAMKALVSLMQAPRTSPSATSITTIGSLVIDMSQVVSFRIK